MMPHNEYLIFERNLSLNLYSTAYDILRKRYVFIKNVFKDENGKLIIIAKTSSDTKYFKYKPNELIHYEF